MREEHRVVRAFVTGGTGFIGSHLVRQLVAGGIEVRLLVRPHASVEASDLPDLDVEVVPGDLAKVHPWARSMEGCDTLFHLAAFYSAQPADAPTLYAVNAGGTQALLAAAAQAGVGRVVHTSTVGTIGRPVSGGLPDEATPFNLWLTGSDYVRSKWLGEAIALWWNARGLPSLVVHPTAPVGPGDRTPTATGQRFVDFLAGRRPDFPVGGMNLCPVEDVAAGLLLAARHGQPGERYVLGHRAGNLDETSFLALLAEASGLPIPPPFERASGRGPASLTVDPSRAVRELGMPQGDLGAAFARAVAFYRAREDRS